ncbi:MAG: hypothetical protein KJ077_11075 [Anaerolineae bacterium]|nr:hypothetical protein [Anaerolineae bacterium]
MLFTHTIPLRGKDRLVYRMLPETGLRHTDPTLQVTLSRGDGAVVIDNSHPKGLLLARAQPAFIPLYYRVDLPNGVVHISTNKHRLKKADVVRSGDLVLIGENGVKLLTRTYDAVERPRPVLDETLDQAVDRLDEQLFEAIKRIVAFHDGKQIAMGLSAGMDSSMIAYYLAKLNVNFKAFTSYLDERNSDYAGAKRVAERLGLDWTPVKLDLETMEKQIRRAIFFAETVEQLHVCMSISRIAMGKVARAAGSQVFIMGDSADGAMGDGPFEWTAAKRIAQTKNMDINDAWTEQRAWHVEFPMSDYFEAETKSFGHNGLEWISPFVIPDLLTTCLSFSVKTCPHNPRKIPMQVLVKRHMPGIPEIQKKVGFIIGNGMRDRKNPNMGMFSGQTYKKMLPLALKAFERMERV